MILSTMSNESVQKHFLSDMKDLKDKVIYYERRFATEVRKLKYGEQTSLTKQLENHRTHQKYIFVWCRGGKASGVHIYAKVQMNKGFHYIKIMDHKADIATIEYTSHFFDRYQERMNVPGDTAHVISHFSKESPGAYRIYHKGKNIVYALDEGLALGYATDRRVQFITFISYNLLKETQKAAYEILRPVMEKAHDIYHNAHIHGLTSKQTDTMFYIANRNIFDNAEIFYNLFFEEGFDVKDLDSFEPQESETLYIQPDFEKYLNLFKV